MQELVHVVVSIPFGLPVAGVGAPKLSAHVPDGSRVDFKAVAIRQKLNKELTLGEAVQTLKPSLFCSLRSRQVQS